LHFGIALWDLLLHNNVMDGLPVRTIKSVLKVCEDLGDNKRENGKRYGYWEVVKK